MAQKNRSIEEPVEEIKLLQKRIAELETLAGKQQQQNKAIKKLNEDLASSNKELEQFAYVASHDLQEPLRTVTSFAELLERRYKGKLDMEADEFITYITQSASRMQALITDLLVLSRIGMRGGEIGMTDYALTKYVNLFFEVNGWMASVSRNASDAKIQYTNYSKVDLDPGIQIKVNKNITLEAALQVTVKKGEDFDYDVAPIFGVVAVF